jgi:ribosomal protein S8
LIKLKKDSQENSEESQQIIMNLKAQIEEAKVIEETSRVSWKKSSVWKPK